MVKYVDVHRHLEAGHSVAALRDTAEKYGNSILVVGGKVLDPHEITKLVVMNGARGWDPFYETVKKTRAAYIRPAAIQELVYQAFIDAAEETDGFEYRFSPVSMIDAYLRNIKYVKGIEDVPLRTPEEKAIYLSYAQDVIGAVLAGKRLAMSQLANETFGVDCGLRLGLSRQKKHLDGLNLLADLFLSYKHEFTGLDVLGAEEAGSLERMRGLIEKLRRDIPDLSIHAGEILGAEAVREALIYNPATIGHGIHAVLDEALMRELARREVILEVCPTSNDLVLPSEKMNDLKARHEGKHPLIVLMENGVQCVVATDDPVPFDTTIEEEYTRARDELGVNVEQMSDIACTRLEKIVRQAA